MDLEAWGNRFVPDLPGTLRRFPFAILLAAAATAVFVAAINALLPEAGDTWYRVAVGLATAAAFATAGGYFIRSRGRDRLLGVLVAYVLPVALIPVFLLRGSALFSPFALPVIAVLWASISPFTEDWHEDYRDDAQDRFWWFNHRAGVSAAITSAALLVVVAGILAIQLTLAVLFGVEIGDIVNRIVLPVVVGLVAPVCWLSTLPKLREYDDRVLTQPDLLANSVGMLAKFVLVPLLLVYAAILVVYAGQIAVARQLPDGLIGWLVLPFLIAGAGTLLLLHPQFLRGNPLVRFYRRWWFWLTLIPLGLFAVAVFVRVDAYGLTPIRLFLAWGGVWGVLLAVTFMIGRGDIRQIPGFAALVLLLASAGPWNIENLPNLEHSLRLNALLSAPATTVEGQPPRFNWSPEELERARGAIDYLSGTDAGRADLEQALRTHGFAYNPDAANADAILATLSVPTPPKPPERSLILRRDLSQPVDVSKAPILLGSIHIGATGMTAVPGSDVTFDLKGAKLQLRRIAEVLAEVDLGPWLARSTDDTVATSFIDLVAEGVTYRLVIDLVSLSDTSTAIAPSIDAIDGLLFTSRAGAT